MTIEEAINIILDVRQKFCNNCPHNYKCDKCPWTQCFEPLINRDEKRYRWALNGIAILCLVTLKLNDDEEYKKCGEALKVIEDYIRKNK